MNNSFIIIVKKKNQFILNFYRYILNLDFYKTILNK